MKKQFKQIENQAQQGRSMVEMLGVLAIIGVLSIGGIAGYSWGMDKHVANQILNEMNLNSLQLAMLLQKGNPDGVTLSLGSPYDDENPTFSTVNYGFDYGCGEGESDEIDFHKCRYIDETRYYIEAYNLPERVAKMVVDAAAGLQYYDGYDEVESQSGENQKDVTVFFDVDPDMTEHETRPEETEPHYTPMPEVTEPTTTTTTTEETTPETTTTEAATTTQASTTAESTTTTTMPETTTTFNGECRTNDDCKSKGDDYFCLSDNYSYNCTGDYYYSGTVTEKDSCKNGTYTCESIGNPSSKKINGTTYYYKATYMNWWSADRYCKALQAQGKVTNGTLVSLEELGCEKGKTGVNVCANGELLKKLYATDSCANGENCPSFSNYVWTSTPYNSESENSCHVYIVNLYNGSVSIGDRGARNYTICE